MHVVVVGGGIVGMASAYYLRERGAEVTVVEKSEIGSGASRRGSGGIRAQFETPVSIDLSLRSMEAWEAFGSEFGVDVGYRRPGYLLLAREEATAAVFRRNVATQNERGVPAEVISPAAAAERCPAIDPDRYVAAAYSPTDGYALAPERAVDGFAAAAREAGVSVRTGVEVTDVVGGDGDRVTGVETTAGRERADYVVNAAGAWGERVAAMAGVDVPITPRRRRVAVVEPSRPVREGDPMTFDYGRSLYMRPARDGGVLLAGGFRGDDDAADPDGYDEGVADEWVRAALDRGAEFADYFEPGLPVERRWAGLYAVTPDYHPVIEESVPGFVNAVGFSGHGFMQAPAAGELVAEIAVDGAASLVDVSALAADRFERGELLPDAHGELYS
ncbi:MAG: NAD(P)/FAD-dependent oxidoreductase [Haloferacaceae archaeon]